MLDEWVGMDGWMAGWDWHWVADGWWNLPTNRAK